MANRRTAAFGQSRRGGHGGVQHVATGVQPVVATSSITPESGTEIGGRTVVLTGHGFATGNAAVTIGGVAATSVVVDSDVQITCVTPKGSLNVASSGVVNTRADVVVTADGGVGTLQHAYTYTSELARLFTTRLIWEGRAAAQDISTSGGVVSSLPNMHGSDPAVQAALANRPAYSASGYRSGPVITGDGNDFMVATLATAIANTKRPYVFAVLKVATVAEKYLLHLSDGIVSNYLIALMDDAANFGAYRGDTTGNQQIAGAPADTDVHLFEMGLTVAGTATLVIDAVATDSTKTGTVGVGGMDRLGLFGAGAGSASNTAIIHVGVLDSIPTGPELTSARAFFKGTYFAGPGYTAGSYGLP